MTKTAISPEAPRSAPPEHELSEFRSAGERLARSFPLLNRRRRATRGADRARQVQVFLRQAIQSQEPNRAWLLENARLIRSAEKRSRDFRAGLSGLPAVKESFGLETARVCLIAREYLDRAENRYTDESFIALLRGYQQFAVLEMTEIWGLKPALELEVLDRLVRAGGESWPDLLTSLRRIGETPWKDIFEAVSMVDRFLEQDPAGAYPRMEFDSRDSYRQEVATLAKYSPSSESEVAERAVKLAEEASAASDGSAAAVRTTHAGYYLVDRGRAALEAEIGYRPPIKRRVTALMLRYPASFYLIGIELLTFAIMLGMLAGLDSFTPVSGALFLFILPATQGAVDFINNLVAFLVPPRTLPRLDFSNGVPDDCATLVAVPTLLLTDAQVHDLVLELEIRYLANRDPNIYFALLTDAPDSQRSVDQRDTLVDVCRGLIEGLNRRYRRESRSPFLLLHRHRIYSESEGRWMGWERKRGKLLDLNHLLRGGLDAFPVKAGDLRILRQIRYVITLDSDTQLPRDSAAKLIGTIAHPLNRAVVDPASRIVVEGYGILQPRVGVSIQSASRSRLAALYSGETGFDIYTHAVSDVYQDLFGEGIFTGKGIYDVDAMMAVLDHRFPDNALLSHDLIEGAYARAALVSDIELIDDYPSHFSAYNRRKHRWVRGDWQILPWFRARVPDHYGRLIPNPISLISRWKIVDNLRRSLLEPGLAFLLLGAWLWLAGNPLYWTAAALIVLFLPVYTHLFFSILRIPRRRFRIAGWFRDTMYAFGKDHACAFLELTFLLHQALLSLDAIARSVLRVFVTKRKLLEWETAAESEAAKDSKTRIDIYLEWTPWISLAIGLLVSLVRPRGLPAASPILALWFCSRGLSAWLNRRPRRTNRVVSASDTEWLRDLGEKMCRFYREWSSPATNWLIPDSVREDGAVEMRLSPTNLGMLLNARIAAVHLGVSTLAEFAFETRQTLDRVAALEKYRGHLFNWYDIASLRPLEPRTVSTVDSGNLAASLWTLKQAALAFAAEPRSKRGLTDDLAAELAEIANACDRLVREMDFTFLYRARRKALSVGYDATRGRMEAAQYDLLASEARIAAFIAIAKGDVPQETWFRLGRSFTLFRGERILLSWTGTMFEYLMPVLWLRHYPGTILEQTVRGVVRAQREYAHRKGVPWGISESACGGGPDGGFGYAPFGIPGLALKRAESRKLVISPYSSFLALGVDPGAALKNLRQMEEYGWSGRYGFYEAVDYTRSGGDVVRCWMAHHQGMSLLSVCNLLFDNPMQQYFHREPQTMATELLLHERVPRAVAAEPEALPAPLPELARAG
jgi:cyclic beta-1,2-glucan synthetase